MVTNGTTNLNLATDYFEQGNQLKQEGKLAEAIAAYEAALRNNTDDAFCHYQLGEALLQTGQTEAAIDRLQTSIRLNPNFSWSHHFLGEAWAKLGKLPEAEAAYRQAIALDSQCSWSHYGLGEVLAAQNQLEAAAACCCRSIELNPTFHGPHHCLRQLLNRHGQLERAVGWYRQAITKDPNSSWLHHFLGEVLALQSKVDEAIACYSRAIELNPDFIWSYYCIAELLMRNGRIYQGIQQYKKVIELQPDFQTIYDNFHFIYYGLKYGFTQLNEAQIDEIISFHRQLIQIRVDQPMPYISIGDLLSVKGEIEPAIGYYQTASYYRLLQTHSHFVEQHWQSQKQQQPNFLIIGTMKSGTTSLYGYLTQHPQILPAIKKEIDFFNYNFHRGFDWYQSHFPPIARDANFITGEATPIYFNDIKSIDRIATSLPNLKLIVVLRNPVARTISHYHHQKTWVFQEQRSLEEAIQREAALLSMLTDLSQAFEIYPQEPGYLFMSLYIYYLARWMSIFPKDRFLVVQSEILYEKPAEIMERIYDFLGVPNHPLGEYENYFPGHYGRSPTPIQQTLAEYFQPHNQRLEEFLGIKFNW